MSSACAPLEDSPLNPQLDFGLRSQTLLTHSKKIKTGKEGS